MKKPHKLRLFVILIICVIILITVFKDDLKLCKWRMTRSFLNGARLSRLTDRDRFVFFPHSQQHLRQLKSTVWCNARRIDQKEEDFIEKCVKVEGPKNIVIKDIRLIERYAGRRQSVVLEVDINFGNDPDSTDDDIMLNVSKVYLDRFPMD